MTDTYSEKMEELNYLCSKNLSNLSSDLCEEERYLPSAEYLYQEPNTTSSYNNSGEVLVDYNYTIDCDATIGQLSSPYYQSALYILYGAIFVLALCGNGLVCYVVQASPRMRTVTNYFIVNLAVGDILMTLLCIPFSFVTTLLLQHWPFGRIMCSTVSYSQAMSVFVSAYTLVAISVDRYMAIMWPLKPRMSKTQAKVVILIVWTIAVITALPIPLVSQLIQPTEFFKTCGRFICEEHWEDKSMRYLYSMTLMVLQYIVPLIVLVFTYVRIAVVVWGKQIPGEAENSRDQRMARSKRKMIKMMVIVVIVFTVCWLPYNSLLIVMDNDENIGTWLGLPYLYFAFHWLAMSHSCYNPVIYCWMNARFKAGYYSVMGHIPGLRALIPDRHRRGASSVMGMTLTGMDSTETTSLNRVNTCTTYISIRRKNNSVCSPPAKSASLRHSGDHAVVRGNHVETGRLNTYPEDEI